MNPLVCLLKPRWWSLKHRILTGESSAKGLLFLLVGALLWIGIYSVSHRLLSYLGTIEEIGEILAYKLLSMVLVTFFALLIFSAILTALSKLFLSRDLGLVHAMPIRRETIFFARWIESTIDSSWMVLLYAGPVMIAYGQVYEAGMIFYVTLAAALVPLCVIASGISSLLVMMFVMVLPASRIRSIVVFLGITVLIILYVTFRLLKPERLVDPDAFASVLLYLQNLQTPAAPWLPSTWAYDGLKAALSNNVRGAIFNGALAWSGAGCVAFLNTMAAKRFYFSGFSKAQMASVRLFQSRGDLLLKLFSFLPGPSRAFIVKEIKTFWRDQTQWSQVFLLAALVVIYLYNFSVLPLDRSPIKTIYLQNLLSFLNVGLAAFVLTAITARFAFPSVSVEGSAFWIVQSSPISLRAFLWIKFFIYLFPLLVLGELLIIATNLLLHVTPFMMGLSVLTIFFLTPGVIAIGIGIGAVYPDFNSENPAQSATSFGGLLFMLLSAAYIAAVIMLEAGPVYKFFIASVKGYRLPASQWLWMGVSFGAAIILSVLAVMLPMAYGERRLSPYRTGLDIPRFFKWRR